MLLKGGMRAVIWTDVFQCFAMLGGMLTVVIKVRSTHRRAHCCEVFTLRDVKFYGI